MNKIKQNLYQKLQGQLSSEKTKLDVDNAYSVVKESVLSFSNFLGGNYKPTRNFGLWESQDVPTTHTLEELFKIWENEK